MFNKVNLLVSLFILNVVLWVNEIKEFNVIASDVIICVVYIRFFSRLSEVLISFFLDVTDGKPKNKHTDKYDRIKLAIISYIEIFIISTCVYAVSPMIGNIFDAIITSLGAGTFTNIEFAKKSWMGLVAVYLQIFTTLTLVLLSIATYIGYSDESSVKS
ncbi:hypothetical protein GCM10027342_54200 [Photobacterium alginatilyticum]